MNALAAIHVGRKQLGLDEDTYRALLTRVTGKASSADMSEAERIDVVDEMRRLGFKQAKTGLEGPFAKKLQAQWIAAWNLGIVEDRADAAMLAFVRRQTGIEHTRFLRDAADARKAVEALKGWMAREAGVDWTDGEYRPQWMRQPGAKIAMAQWQILARAGLVDIGFPAFQAFVAERAFRPLGQMTPGEWRGVMNTLGARVRKVKR